MTIADIDAARKQIVDGIAAAEKIVADAEKACADASAQYQRAIDDLINRSGAAIAQCQAQLDAARQQLEFLKTQAVVQNQMLDFMAATITAG